MDYYARRGITGIGQGVIVMQRAGRRANWFAVESAPANITYPSGEDVALLVKLRTFLHTMGREMDFLNAHLKMAPNVRLEQACEVSDGTWRQVSGQVRRIGGLGFFGALDGPSAAALARWDGTRPLKDYLNQMAAALNTDPPHWFRRRCRLFAGWWSKGF